MESLSLLLILFQYCHFICSQCFLPLDLFFICFSLCIFIGPWGTGTGELAVVDFSPCIWSKAEIGFTSKTDGLILAAEALRIVKTKPAILGLHIGLASLALSIKTKTFIPHGFLYWFWGEWTNSKLNSKMPKHVIFTFSYFLCFSVLGGMAVSFTFHPSD